MPLTPAGLEAQCKQHEVEADKAAKADAEEPQKTCTRCKESFPIGDFLDVVAAGVLVGGRRDNLAFFRLGSHQHVFEAGFCLGRIVGLEEGK